MDEHDVKDDAAIHGKSGSINENNNKDGTEQKEEKTGSKGKKESV